MASRTRTAKHTVMAIGIGIYMSRISFWRFSGRDVYGVLRKNKHRNLIQIRLKRISNMIDELTPMCFPVLIVVEFIGFSLLLVADCYDPLDPNGNITVTFDIHEWTDDGYVARVTIHNYYHYRHVDEPGWNIGWTWTRNEVIWSMNGAFATVQGDCLKFKHRKAHSCVKSPVIADLMPEAPATNKSEDCCRNGLISAWSIDPANAFSSFDMTVGNLEINSTGYSPANLTLLAPGPGYTCSLVQETEPTKSSDIGGKREVQVFKTWKSTCTYSRFQGTKAPVCCVSLSTFYNPKVTSCPDCSCGCRATEQQKSSCIREGSILSNISKPEMVQCTDHMCPVGVHWHVSNNYADHWRAKLTVSNYNYERNYTDWNVLVQHPGFSNKTRTYSFNSSVLPTVGFSDATALFWGINYYNTELLQADETQLGSVTTDILLEKDSESFTLRNGWALPRRINFNGEECMMPLPDDFPMLPNRSSFIVKPTKRTRFLHLLLGLLIFYFI